MVSMGALTHSEPRVLKEIIVYLREFVDLYLKESKGKLEIYFIFVSCYLFII